MAASPTISSADEFVRLRTSENLEEHFLAANGSAAEGVWEDVIARFPDMRVWVAHNKTVPLEILRGLAHDPQADVRAAVAMKRKLDDSLFELLSGDRDDSVRLRLACNRKTPSYILARLSSDKSPLVRQAADRDKNA
jgi:hypothetical protein